MVGGKFSCIKEITKTLHIALPTACTSNEISGICDVLESWKRQYIQQLQGIVGSYKNVTLKSVRGYINLDCPVVHHDVMATFELFNPTAGSILEGKINRVSYDHIGCLVNGTINVTIDRPDKSLGNLSNLIVLDRMILFQITRLDFKGKIIRVRGKITRECLNLMEESDPLSFENNELNCTPSESNTNVENRKRRRISNETASDLTSEGITSDTSHSSPKKKKSKTFDNYSLEQSLGFEDSVQDSPLESQNSTDASSLPSTSKKKKKHKKSKNDELSSPPLFRESIESDKDDLQPPEIEFSTISAINDFRNVNSLEDHVEYQASPHSSLSNIHQLNSKKKNSKKLKTKLPENNAIANNTLHNSSFESVELKEPHELLLSPSKKKKSKKTKENSSKSSSSKKSLKSKKIKTKSTKLPNDSPKKKNKSKSSSSSKKKSSKSNDSSLSIKEEKVSTDSSSNSKSKETSENFVDIYEMMEALASYEPPPEAQLLANISPSEIKTEPLDVPKESKKRKRDSIDASTLPKKKRKTEDSAVSSESKDKERKGKKKKEKSKKDSKKDKKKSKNKVISSKKKGHGYKVNLKKNSKKKKDKDKGKKKKLKTET